MRVLARASPWPLDLPRLTTELGRQKSQVQGPWQSGAQSGVSGGRCHYWWGRRETEWMAATEWQLWSQKPSPKCVHQEWPGSIWEGRIIPGKGRKHRSIFSYPLFVHVIHSLLFINGSLCFWDKDIIKAHKVQHGLGLPNSPSSSSSPLPPGSLPIGLRVSFDSPKVLHALLPQQTMENSERDGNTRPPDLPLDKLYAGQEATIRSGHGTTD